MAIYILRSFFQITKTKGKKFPLRPKACNQIIIEKKQNKMEQNETILLRKKAYAVR